LFVNGFSSITTERFEDRSLKEMLATDLEIFAACDSIIAEMVGIKEIERRDI